MSLVRSASGHLPPPVIGRLLWRTRLRRTTHDAEAPRAKQLLHSATQLRIDRDRALRAVEHHVAAFRQVEAQSQRLVAWVTADNFAKRRQYIGAVNIFAHT